LSKWLLLGLLPGVVSGLAGTRELPSAAPIALYTRFQRPPAARTVQAMQDELQSVMEPLGLDFSWRKLDPEHTGEVVAELAVVTFRGRCDAEGLMPVEATSGALGWTHMSDGAILPFSEVDCDHIRGFLQKALLAMPLAERQRAFGRAIARVLAHELYHIFANTTRHASCGIAKSGFTVKDLLDPAFQFEERALRSFRQSRSRGQFTP